MPPGGVCNGKFLLELFDDGALFMGLFLLIGFFAHAWRTVSQMPSRAMSRTAPHEEAPFSTKEVDEAQQHHESSERSEPPLDALPSDVEKGMEGIDL